MDSHASSDGLFITPRLPKESNPVSQNSPRKFAFIAHYVETWNWLLNIRAFSFLHAHPGRRWLVLPLYPVCWIMSAWYIIGSKPFNIVDEYEVNGALKGYTILIRNFAWHFLLPDWHDRIRRRILAAVLHAQNILKVDVVGLGALAKDETVTSGGRWITAQPEVRVPVVHGDTCTAHFVIRLLDKMLPTLQKEDAWIAVVGPTSKIGRAVILSLASRGFRFLMYTASVSRFEAIRNELSAIAPSLIGNIRMISDLAEARTSPVWLIGKARPAAKILARYIRKGAIIINFSVPDPLSPKWVKKIGARHLDGGLALLPSGCGMHFTMRLRPGITYACAAGTMVHAWLKWVQHEVGDVRIDEIPQVQDACERLGFSLPPPSSHLAPVRY